MNKKYSLHTGQLAHQVFLLPPGWDASPLQGYPQN